MNNIVAYVDAGTAVGGLILSIWGMVHTSITTAIRPIEMVSEKRFNDHY
jgi:hypothetical protein